MEGELCPEKGHDRLEFGIGSNLRRSIQPDCRAATHAGRLGFLFSLIVNCHNKRFACFFLSRKCGRRRSIDWHVFTIYFDYSSIGPCFWSRGSYSFEFIQLAAPFFKVYIFFFSHRNWREETPSLLEQSKFLIWHCLGPWLFWEQKKKRKKKNHIHISVPIQKNLWLPKRKWPQNKNSDRPIRVGLLSLLSVRFISIVRNLEDRHKVFDVILIYFPCFREPMCSIKLYEGVKSKSSRSSWYRFGFGAYGRSRSVSWTVIDHVAAVIMGDLPGN